MGFLDGLKKFGLGNIEEEELYEEPKKETATEAKPAAKKPAQPTITEESLLFDKSYTCPVCDIKFTAKTIRTGKIRVKAQDIDLRNIYTEIDPGKYDVAACPECGYAALVKYYGNLTNFQIEEIKKRICANYKIQEFSGSVYSYEEARSRYELALANAVVRKAKNSEKAYICLKLAWVIRGETEHLDPDMPKYEEKKKENEAQEKDLLKKALDGFVIARQSETPPIAGMDTFTLDYLMSALGYEVGEYDISKRLLGELLVSRTAGSRIKDKARELKELILEKEN